MKTSDQALDTRSNNPSLEAMPKKSKYPPVSADQTVSESFATILRHNFENLGRWEQTAHSGSDIEGVHQLRVTVRRMRSALPLFESAIPRSSDRHWRQEMRWLAGELGLARDLDVFISEVLVSLDSELPLKDADRFMRIAQRRRARAYEEQVRGMLDSGRYRRFKEGFGAWLDSPGMGKGRTGCETDAATGCEHYSLCPKTPGQAGASGPRGRQPCQSGQSGGNAQAAHRL